MQQEFTKELRRFRPVIAHIVAISILIGVAALGPTLYNMAVYDQIIMSGSSESLWPLLWGVGLAFIVELTFRDIRSRQLAYFGARLDHFISHRIFQRFLSLPTSLTERASVSAQVARMRDFDSVRDFFTGALAPLLFELPLVAVYVIVMACIAPVLTLVPVVLVASYMTLIWSSFNRFREASAETASAAAKKQEFIMETVTKLNAIRIDGMESGWRNRYVELSNNSAQASAAVATLAQNFETMSYALMTMGAVATLSIGVVSVIGQSLTVGALVASMILIWRVVSPLQICCASMTRLQQLSATFNQILRMMNMISESDYIHDNTLPGLAGEVELYRVGMRYMAEAEPALLGVSFKVKAGQIVAVRGVNGSGKSTLLKMIMGLYTPQSGCVRLDGIDIRQRDPMALRRSISYVPQQACFFPGTIRENLLFCAPNATEREINEALKMSCAVDEVAALPQGLDTAIAGEGAEVMSFLLRQRINLARAYLRPASIMLFDEASHSLGAENDRAFNEYISACRGKKTIIMVTHRDDHTQLADQVLFLDKGELVRISAPSTETTRQKGLAP